jgi:uncharacterized protein YjiS (DUF1127 family)
MTRTFSTTAFFRTTGTKRYVLSLFGRCRDRFGQWRKREKLRADLCAMNDRELQDIGIARGEIDYVVSHRTADPRRKRWIVARTIIVAMLCNACAIAFMSEARGQCSARDVLQNRLTHKEAAPCGHPSRRPPLAGPQDEDRVWGRRFDEHRCRLASS